jgi:uncharacterized protein involved in exopolysaccharide biosynthesis
MPITRRDDTVDPLDPYILVLWDKKWLIVGVAILTAILVYVILLFVPSSYKVSSEIFVNRLPALTDGESPNPESVVSLLESPSVLEKVRDDYAKQYNIDPVPPIERFVKQFSVESQILQDTSVRKEYSPVLILEVESQGAAQTRYIMDRWIYNFIKVFGNYTATEAVMKRQAYEAEKHELEKTITELEREQAIIDARLPYLRKILAEKLEQLSPARLRLRDDLGEGGSNNVTLDLSLPRDRMTPGLLERYLELELLQRTGSTTVTSQLAALSAAIVDVETSVTVAQEELGKVLFQQRNVSRQLQTLRNTYTGVNDAYSRFVVASALYRDVSDSELPAGGDIRALTMPVTPELRVWPKRTTSAGVAGIAAAILTMFAILARNFLTKISPRRSQ